jgi:O-antigen ligase
VNQTHGSQPIGGSVLRFAMLLLLVPLLAFPYRWPALSIAALSSLVGIWIWRWHAFGAVFPPSRLNPALLGILLAGCAAMAPVIEPGLALPRLLGLAIGASLLLAVVDCVNSPKTAKLAVMLFGGLGVALSVVAVVATEWQPGKLGVFDAIYGQLPRLIRGVVPGTPEGGINPNEVAGVLLGPLLVAAGLVLAPGGSRWLRLSMISVVAVTGAVLALTQSRSGYLGLLGGMTVLLFGLIRSQRGSVPRGPLTAALLVLLLTLGSLAASLARGFVDPETAPLGSLDSRITLWRISWPLIADMPLTGSGLGQFDVVAHLLTDLPPELANVTIPHAHNFILQAALDLGVLGAISVVALLVQFFQCCADIERGAVRPLPSHGWALAAAMVAFLCYGLTDTIALGARGGLVFWVLVGVAAATARAVGAPRALPPFVQT